MQHVQMKLNIVAIHHRESILTLHLTAISANVLDMVM